MDRFGFLVGADEYRLYANPGLLTTAVHADTMAHGAAAWKVKSRL
jgi:hypothetical protein